MTGTQQRPPRSDTRDLARRIGNHAGLETCPLVTCFRCAADFYVIERHNREPRERCPCGRVFFQRYLFGTDHHRALCIAPVDQQRFVTGL